MRLVGLGGGIGAGKSTVSKLLSERGAFIVDADLVARQVVEPGTPALAKIVERFGSEMVDADGALRRQALAGVVFNDAKALADLNAITHPAIAVEMTKQVQAHVDTDHVVIYDAALLFDSAKVGMVGRMVVDVDPAIAVQRLMAFRGFSEADAKARVASQMSRDDRLSKADFVIDNSGSVDALVPQVAAALAWIASLPSSPVPPPEPRP